MYAALAHENFALNDLIEINFKATRETRSSAAPGG